MAKKNKDTSPEEEVKTDENENAENAEQQEETVSKESELEKELAAAKEAHVRTLAEYDNYRKRSTREKEAAYGDSKAACLTELLPVLDNFDRALATTDSDLDSFKKGMEMIYTNFCDIITKLGVEPFGEKGEKFDPNIHNGVMHVDDEELGENVIADVFSKGYKLGDRILRPAMVKVAN
ncbi:MAG: nucleotide exchange factor GrpE [Faecalibacterium sp.]|nr:nucleotide exchange factor GrpE [Ruminococcus sp.]MCM1392961.1 nucleotide exchange factor GrpE [Ruminococcus sp.]MCM1486498.1 nucleotide exchange factor GrpE [Faecalibacterium sp.]